MTAFIIRRLGQGLIILILVTILTFLLLRLLPGDPLMLYVSQNELQNLSPDAMQQLKVKFGLDQPLPLQYVSWISSLFHGDLGASLLSRVPISQMIARSLPITIYLGTIAIVITAIFGIAAGVISAWKRGSWIDTIVTTLANLGITAPEFWVGVLLIYFLALKLNLLPVMGFTSPFTDFWHSTSQVIMPVICISIGGIASIARQTRSSVLEVVRQDYIRTAWSKGLSERLVVVRHVLRNALIPIVTLLGLRVRNIFGGALVVETVFNIPGMGRLAADALFSLDYPVTQAVVLITATVVVLSNITVDISYGFLDPRIRYD